MNSDSTSLTDQYHDELERRHEAQNVDKTANMGQNDSEQVSFEPRELKYVILRSDRAVFLSPQLSHNDIVGPNVCVQSAGQCRLTWSAKEGKIKVSAYGKSLTLNVSSKAEDAEILEATVNEMGY